MEKYFNYQTEDFVTDLLFMEWVYSDDKEAAAFFTKLIKHYPHTEQHINEARSILLKLKIEKPQVSASEIEQSWIQFEAKVSNSKPGTRLMKRVAYWSMAAAAVIALTLLVTIGLRTRQNELTAPDYTSILAGLPTEINKDEIQLIFDSRVITLQKDDKVSYKDNKLTITASKNGRETLKSQYEINDKCTLNKLIVPNGKQSHVLLADGSELIVNSGSTLIYPAAFGNDKREIFLDGETYLNVARDENCRFEVVTQNMNVEVLGTSFNVSAYSDDNEQSVVLVSGKVQIHSQDNNMVLKPNQRYKENTDGVKVDYVDASDYVCWKDGLMNIDSENLDNILKRLERYYNVSFVNNVEDTLLKCNGKLDLTNDIQFVLTTIENTAPIQFIKEENQYVVKQLKKEVN